MVIIEDRPVCLQDLDQAWAELHRIEDSGDTGELIVALHRFQNQVGALTLGNITHFDRERGYTAIGALSMTQ